MKSTNQSHRSFWQIGFKLSPRFCFIASVHLLWVTSYDHECLDKFTFLQPIMHSLCFIFCMIDFFRSLYWVKMEGIFTHKIVISFNSRWLWMRFDHYICYINVLIKHYRGDSFSLKFEYKFFIKFFHSFYVCPLLYQLFYMFFLFIIPTCRRAEVVMTVVGLCPIPYLSMVMVILLILS